MNDGEVVQIGTPVELFERPQHTFVGHFIGSPGMNLLPCDGRSAGVARVGGQAVVTAEPVAERQRSGAASCEIGVRPEFVRFAEPRALPVRVAKVADVGRYRIVETRHGDHDQAAGRAKATTVPSEQRHLHFDPAHTQVYADGWMRRTSSAREHETAQQQSLVPGAAGGAAGRLQRRHPADDGGQLLGAGDLRQQPVLLRGRALVRATSCTRRASTTRCSASCCSPRSSWPSRSRSAWRSRWRCRARAVGLGLPGADGDAAAHSVERRRRDVEHLCAARHRPARPQRSTRWASTTTTRASRSRPGSRWSRWTSGTGPRWSCCSPMPGCRRSPTPTTRPRKIDGAIELGGLPLHPAAEAEARADHRRPAALHGQLHDLHRGGRAHRRRAGQRDHAAVDRPGEDRARPVRPRPGGGDVADLLPDHPVAVAGSSTP